MDDCFENCAESFGRMSGGTRCSLLSLCLGFVALIVYVAVAIEGVEPTEYALIRNNLSQDINQNEVLEGGLHWVGLFYSLIHFPAIHKSIEFSDDSTAQQTALSTRTKEGLELHLHFAFQYALRKDELPQMYRMLQNDYESIFTRIARNSVLHIAGDYVAPGYWMDRGAIGKSMNDTLRDDLIEAHADVSGFMLLKIDLPDVYEGAIVSTEVTNQEMTTYQTLRSVQEISQETENIKAAALAKINVINANATANATMVLNQGAGGVAKQNIMYTTTALQDVQQKLNFTDPKTSLLEYFTYQRLNGLKDDTNNKLMVGQLNATVFQ